nr:hypothetical protein [Tanacetum cinerariifolium]
MHNNIMTAGLRDRPLMLGTGRYAQWQSRFLTYNDTRPNGDALRKCIPAVPITHDSLKVPERTAVETILTLENNKHYQSEKEAIHLLLTGIEDEIYSTVDACKTAHDMWIVIERSTTTTRYKGKEIAKPITPPSESACEEDSDPEQAQMDTDMQKNLALTSKYKNDNHTSQFGNQRTVTVAKARETVEQADWLEDTDEEIDEQELEAHYSYMAKIQEVPIADSGTDTEPLEKVQYDAEYNVFANERHDSEQPESISNTCVVEKIYSNVIPDLPNMCDNDIQTD